jgi:hypothetical protein
MVRQYVVNREEIYAPARGETISRFMSGWLKTGSAGQRRNHFPFHVWLAQNWISQCDYLAADVCKINCSQPTKIAQRKNLLMENQICSGRINFANGESILLTENHELSFILLAI